jgi:hypothetical protein
MIDRRGFMAAAAAGAIANPPSPLPVPADNKLDFHVVRDGHVIGTHALYFTASADTLLVHVVVDIVVGFGPIAFFRYRHRAMERWVGGRVDAIDSETNDDGTPLRMTVRRDDAGLVIEGTKMPRYVAEPATVPGSHWNRAMLDAPFINTQSARLMKPSVSLVGMDMVDVAGAPVQTRHYALRGDVDLDTYYDLTPSWAGLRFVAKDGSAIRYLKA